MLNELNEELNQSGISLALAEVHGEVRDLLHAEGMAVRIPGVAKRTRIGTLIAERRHGLLAVS